MGFSFGIGFAFGLDWTLDEVSEGSYRRKEVLGWNGGIGSRVNRSRLQRLYVQV